MTYDAPDVGSHLTAKTYTVAEAAERLGLDPSLVRVYCREGRIKADHFGKSWRISEAALVRFEANRPKRGRPPRSAGPAPSPRSRA